MLRKFSTVTLLLLVSAAWGASTPSQDQALNIQSAVKMALENSPTVLNARESVNEAKATISQGYSSFFPTISASASASYKKDPLNLGNPAFGGEPYNQYAFGFTANQPLYTGGAALGALAAAKKESDIRRLNVEIAERDLTFRVLQSFYSILLTERRVKTLLELQEVQKELLSTSERRFRSGLSQKLEVLQLRTQLALLTPKIADARNGLSVAGMDLANLLGMREARDIQVRGVLEPIPYDRIEGLLKQENFRLLELAKNQLLQEQLDSRKSVTLAKHWPQIGLLGNYGRTSFVKSELLDNYSTSWAFGLQLSIPIFSGMSSVAERKVLASQTAQLEIEEIRLKDQLSLDQVKAKKQLELSKTQIETSRIALQIAQESLNEARRTYRLGTSTYLQLYESENKFVDATFSYDQARYDAIVAQGKFLTASGVRLSAMVGWLAAEVTSGAIQ